MRHEKPLQPPRLRPKYQRLDLVGTARLSVFNCKRSSAAIILLRRQGRAADISAELAPPAEPHYDDRREYAEHSSATIVVIQKAGPWPRSTLTRRGPPDTDDTRKENHKGVDHPWINASVTMSPLATCVTSWPTRFASSWLILLSRRYSRQPRLHPCSSRSQTR